MLVSGSDFYCGNSSGSPCQFALKNEISSVLNKYDRCAVRRDTSGAILYEDETIGNVTFELKGAITDGRHFSFSYDAEYPIWFLQLSCKGSYSSSGGTLTISGDINGYPISGGISMFSSGSLILDGETHFDISIDVTYTGTASRNGYSFDAPLIISHNYY